MELFMPAKDCLKNTRYILGQSQREFAEFLDVHYGTLSLWETGKRKPGFTNIRKIVDKINSLGREDLHLEYTDLIEKD